MISQKLTATLLFLTLVIISVGWIERQILVGKQIDADTALAVYGVETQSFVIFATLTPIFLALVQLRHPNKRLVRNVGVLAAFVIASSVVGMCICIAQMVAHDFDAVSLLILWPIITMNGGITTFSVLALSDVRGPWLDLFS